MFGKHKNKELSHYLKHILGYRIRNIHLYEQVFIHRSYKCIEKNSLKFDNERLEYLGDAILGAVMADFLYKKYPYAKEGFLTSMRSKLVSREHLNRLSVKIGLDKFVMAHNQLHHTPSSIYGNTFEAFVGAIFLDKGYNKTKKILLTRIIDLYVDLDSIEKADNNYKGKLLHYAQKYKQKLEYKTVKDNTLPYGIKEFVVCVFMDEKCIAEGYANSLKAAQQNAAMTACELLNI